MSKWDPSYWFLEIADDTAGVNTVNLNQVLKSRLESWNRKRKDWGFEKNTELTLPYTSNNEVKALVDGTDYMGDLNSNLTLLGKDDFVLLAGWEFWQYRSLTQRVLQPLGEHVLGVLKRSPPANDATSLTAVLKQAVDRGVGIRVLAFGKGPPGCDKRTKHFVEEVNGKCNHSACLAAPSNFAMSHHQKEVLLGRASFDDSRAYVGGIDLGIHRMDDPAHKANFAEWGLHTRRTGNFGWHDIQVVIKGDALVQLWANFAERWRDARTVDQNLLHCPIPEWAGWGRQNSWDKRNKNIGKKHVQVLRTIGEASTSEGNRGRFMPEGERTVLCALKKAIDKAECYIYIEEQFLWDCELADFIAQKMNKQGSQLHLIIVMTAGCELPGQFGEYGLFLRDAFFRKILSVDRMTGNVVFGDTTRIYPYGLFQTSADGHKEIYVHSKLVIIDDRYVAIGSANVDARSMHIETELTLGIVDGETVNGILNKQPTTVCKFAKELRMKLWMEHSGQAQPIDDPIAALKSWFPGVGQGAWPDSSRVAKQRQKHHLRCYINKPGANLSRPWMRRLIDRNDRKFYAFT